MRKPLSDSTISGSTASFYDETITGLIGVYEAEELMPFNSE